MRRKTAYNICRENIGLSTQHKAGRGNSLAIMMMGKPNRAMGAAILYLTMEVVPSVFRIDTVLEHHGEGR
jgi:hypothetical protein